MVETLEKVVLRKKYTHPSSLPQAQLNIFLALDTLTKRYPNKFLPSFMNYEQVAERILRGEKAAVWQVLSKLREVYPQSNKCSAIPWHLTNTGLERSQEEVASLEQRMIAWLRALRLASETDAALPDVEERVRSGVLLCELANALHKYRSKVHGVVSQPKNQAAALSNIKKAFALFRQLPMKNKRYLWSEKEILKGDRGAILGLLEHLYKFYNNLNRDKSCGQYQTVQHNKRSVSPISRSITSPKYYKETDTSESYDAPSTHTPVPYPYPCALKRPASRFNELNSKVLSPQDTANESEGRKLLVWIGQLGVNVGQEGLFSAENMRLWTSGVLLARIVGRLERKTIEGISERPKSSASSLHNIRKVLNALKGKKSIPVEYLYSDVEIQSGDQTAIMNLLKSIRSAYPSSSFFKRCPSHNFRANKRHSEIENT